MRWNNFHFILLCFFCSISFVAKSQDKKQGKRIECTADILRYDASKNPDIQILTGNVIFTHEGAICYADTAFYNERTNIIEAFGKELIIHINDTVHLYGEYLIYNGNTRVFVIRENVILSDEYSVLYTDQLTYERNENVGFYDNHGKIINDSNTLISEQGWYYTHTKDVYFNKDVVLTTPDYEVFTDTLKYNTQRKIAYFLSPTHIYSDSSTIYCEYGWYDTENEVYQFEKNAKINTNRQYIEADLIWYDKLNGKAHAYRDVSIFDSVENVLILGEYVEYNEPEEYSFVTDSALAVFIDGNDSLFIHADTLWAKMDSVQNVEYVSAYHKVLFYRNDLQGSCDSLVYMAEDSIITMFRSPVVWFEKKQTLADTIHIFIENKAIKNMHLIKNSFICEDIFTETKFNQIKGVNMFIYFENNQLNNIFVDAEAECIYYVLDDDKALIGVNSSVSKQMRILFQDNEVSSIILYDKVKGDLSPEADLKKTFLQDFIWLESYRPKNKWDIFGLNFYKPELKTDKEDYE